MTHRQLSALRRVMMFSRHKQNKAWRSQVVSCTRNKSYRTARSCYLTG